eukprot:UN02094
MTKLFQLALSHNNSHQSFYVILSLENLQIVCFGKFTPPQFFLFINCILLVLFSIGTCTLILADTESHMVMIIIDDI